MIDDLNNDIERLLDIQKRGYELCNELLKLSKDENYNSLIKSNSEFVADKIEQALQTISDSINIALLINKK